MTTFSRNWREIERDPALRWYGAALSAAHALAVAYWCHERIWTFVTNARDPICWPLLPNCEAWRVFSPMGLEISIALYAAAGLGIAWLFIRSRTLERAWAALLALTVVNIVFLSLDFRLRLNQHMMHLFASFVFLFVPRKRDALRATVVLFYFWAGMLKLNSDWLGGSTLYAKPWLIPAGLVPWACKYVVVLELLLVWGLLATGPVVFWAVLAQVALFHLLSFPIVGFYYPLLMFGLLSIFPLCRHFAPPAESARLDVRPAITALVFFSLLQLVPHLFPGDTALTGEGRLFGLHMFDALVVCESHAIIRRKGEPPFAMQLHTPMAIRHRCDPIVFWNRARELCRREKAHANFIDLDLHLMSRRNTQAAYRAVIDVSDFCRKNPGYSVWRHNDWIRP